MLRWLLKLAMLNYYARVYYTLYRMILKVANMFDTESETPRSEVALVLSLLTGINIITIVGLVEVFIERSVFPEQKVYVMIILSPIVFVNFLLIFYKHRYKKVEENLSLGWRQDKSKNILITALYILITVVFFFLSVEYIKNHSLISSDSLL